MTLGPITLGDGLQAGPSRVLKKSPLAVREAQGAWFVGGVGFLG